MTPTSRDADKDGAVPDDTLREPLDSLSIELTRISAEIQSINSGFQALMEQAVAQVRETIENEIACVLGQVEGVTKEIAAMLDDPSVELARVMRKRTEQAELKAYLNGLRFSARGQSKAKVTRA